MMQRSFAFLLMLFSGLVAQLPAFAEPLVEIKTNLGAIVVELDREKAPATVENFLAYAKRNFYNDTIFHRVMDGFMIQGGGFTRDMAQKPTTSPVRNEANNGLKNQRGSIAMARTGNPHSATAQFFINHKDNPGLDHPSPDGWGYTVFGKTVQGLDVVDRIAKVPTGNRVMHQNVPLEPVLIESVRIISNK